MSLNQSIAGCLLASALMISSVCNAQLLSDPMDIGTNWTVATEGFITPTATAEFGYDYSADGIPEAPNSLGGAATSGLKLEVNVGAGVAEEILVFSNAQFTGQYTVQADIWINFPIGGSGTTEFAGLNVGADNQMNDSIGGGFDGTNGASLIYSSDGDAARDYQLYKDAGEQFPASLQYGTNLMGAIVNGDLGNVAGVNNNTGMVLTEAFPPVAAPGGQGQTGSTAAGAGGLQWMTMKVEVDPDGIGEGSNEGRTGLAKFSMTSAASNETLLIATMDNTNGNQTDVSTEGFLGLVMADIFSSNSSDASLSFALFDNILVTEGISSPDNADFNGDLTVDLADYPLWRNNLGATGTGLTGDANFDGTVDSADYDIWVAQYGTTIGTVGATATIPEPSSVILTVGALVIGGLAVRRQLSRN